LAKVIIPSAFISTTGFGFVIGKLASHWFLFSSLAGSDKNITLLRACLSLKTMDFFKMRKYGNPNHL
jgi:hypothetical protein